MDEAQRRELEARRAAQRDRNAEPRPQGAIVRRLARCGIPHTLTVEGIWTPSYLPVTAIRIYWDGAPDPARWDYCDTLRKRIDTVRSMLEEVADPDDLLRFSYDSGFDSNFTIRARDVMQKGALAIVLRSYQTIWITGFPDQWLIECGDYHTVRLATPPPGYGEAEAGRDAAWFEPLTEALKRKAIPSVMTSSFNPNGPAPPTVLYDLRRKGWSGVQRSVSEGIQVADTGPLGQALALKAVLEPYLSARIDATAAVVVDLIARDAPRLQLPMCGLLDAMPGLRRLLGRSVPDAPGGPIHSPTIRLYADGGDWLVEISHSGRYITVRAIG